MPYSQTDFAVDHANITDAINRFWWAVDRGEWTKDVDAYYAEEVVVDYTAVMGGEVHTLKGDARKEFFLKFGSNLDRCHHAISTINIDLPQPSPDASRPTLVTLKFNSNVAYVQESAKNGTIMNAGSWYVFKMKLDPEATGNPWRIAYYEAHASWFTGNAKLLLDPENA